jgi:hypothetical protein
MQKGRREGRREVGMTTVSRCERGAKEVRGCNPRRCHATQTDTFEWVERYLSVFYALLLLLLFLLLCFLVFVCYWYRGRAYFENLLRFEVPKACRPC